MNEEENNPVQNFEKVNEANKTEVVNNTVESNSEKKNNALALASFICSLVGLLIFGMPCGLAAIVTGILGIVKFDEETEKNKWMAIVGLVLGAVDFVIVAIFNVYLRSNLL